MTDYNRGNLNLDAAVEAYGRGVPVVVLSTDEDLLHGEETLQVIARLGTALRFLTIRDVSVDDWKNSDWPEVLESARQVFMEEGGFELE